MIKIGQWGFTSCLGKEEVAKEVSSVFDMLVAVFLGEFKYCDGKSPMTGE